MAQTENDMPTSCRQPILQVLICTYGYEGLQRVAASSHPKVDGVEYIVSIQQDPDADEHPAPKELNRDDFKLFVNLTKGLSINRNVALSLSSAPLLLISDDDVDYTEEGLRNVIDAFHRHKDMDIIAFRYTSMSHEKSYPSSPCNLDKPTKGYFVTSFEIALRRESVQGKIWFNENFGIGAMFPAGEEELFIRDCLDAGLKGIFIPITIARHDSKTTSNRNLMMTSRPQTKGAVLLRLHPKDWPLRMIVHTLREIPLWKKGLVPSPISYSRNWLKGVRLARKMKVFPTPDYSLYYQRNDKRR
ncbi:MAG: hypothetical protein K2L45_09840 [Muribaculaceae bacterium]|nr:hypothetical protein [Muribaculaceae bacterium]